MIHTLAEEFTREVQLLCATPVSNQDWQAFLDTHIPQVTPTGQPLTGRASTLADRKRAVLQQLWTRDPRVSPWAGTAHGVLQAVNTYDHHEGVVRGADRAERNSLKTLTDGYRHLDRTTLQTLTRVLQQAA